MKRTWWQRNCPVLFGLILVMPYNIWFMWPAWWLGVLTTLIAGAVMGSIDAFIYKDREG